MKRSNDAPARAAMKWLCTMLGILLATMMSITLMFQYWLIQTSQASVQDFPIFSLKLPQWDLQELFAGDSQKIGGTGSDIVNILLIGQDAKEGDGAARSDSIILCTYHKQTHRVTLTSFLRDLYVPIPGHGKNRINAAYAAGGMSLLEQTLEENFQLKIDGAVEVDFSHFAEIIDLVGGVEMELRQDEANYINEKTGSLLTEGTWLLNGEQALAYSRIRSLDADGDFSRTDRQRKVLSAVMEHLKATSLKEQFALVEDLLPMLTTDIGAGKMLSLALEILPNLSELTLHSQYVPTAGTYTDQRIDGMAVLVADTEAIRQMLEQTLLPEEE